jgi:hypothetical protein
VKKMRWFVTSWLVGWFVFSAFAAEGKDGKDIQVLAASVKGRLFQLLISIDREKGKPKETVEDAYRKLCEYLQGTRPPQDQDALRKALSTLDQLMDNRSPSVWWLTRQSAIVSECDRLALALTEVRPIPYKPFKPEKRRLKVGEEFDPIAFHAFKFLQALQDNRTYSASYHLSELLKLLKEPPSYRNR